MFGPSGYGKSTYVQQFLTKEAALHRDSEYLLIVPDQFTLETQRIMAAASPAGGILNIDVLSFGRLSHRIFSEVGRPERVLLDDLGKCLILRRVIQESENELKVLKKGIHTPGYVEEVKSVLSEFMQYGIRPGDLEKSIASLKINPALKYKLEDFLFLYKAFEKALGEKYTTREESMHCLAERIPLSKLIQRSTLVFDGFTGFTPIQNEVIGVLLENAKEVIITLPYGLECMESGKQAAGESENAGDFAKLFYLTEKTVWDLTKEAKERNIPVLPAHFEKESHRFENAPSVAYLERNLFRQTEADYPFVPEEIHISKAQDEVHECKIMCRQMFELIEKRGYKYRDMAVVCGDLQGYAEVLKQQFEKYGIPYFTDATAHLTENPFVCYISALFDVITGNYAYRDVCALLKSPFSGFEREETDLFENYILAKRIRGAGMYRNGFKNLTVGMYRATGDLPDEVKNAKRKEMLDRINHVRSRLTEILGPLEELEARKDVTAREWLTAIYGILLSEDCAGKLEDMADIFASEGDPGKELEYRQVYKKVMDLFDQIVSLIGDEVITLSELSEVLDTGFGEIKIGLIPKGVDLLPVCDLIRSRFSDIKVLFFLGVNEGNIPRTSAGGGLLSDMERSSLMEQGMDLAPNRAMESFTQQLYLYQTLTKPSEELYLSYLSVTESGESRKAAYLIDEIKKLFPKLEITDEVKNSREINPEDLSKTLYAHTILSERDVREEFALLLGEGVSGELTEEERAYLFELYGILKANPENNGFLEDTVSNAFGIYSSAETKLNAEIAKKIFMEADEVYKCSVSSLENFAGCAYRHFLDYGLGLAEREIGEIASSDTGSIKHAVLDAFGKFCAENHEDFATVTDEKVSEIIDRIVDHKIEDVEESLRLIILENPYLIGRIKRIMKRSVNTLKAQLEGGKYRPVMFEHRFERMLTEEYKNAEDAENAEGSADAEKDALQDKAAIRGSIDRIDTAEEDAATYVKIIDYKSGSKDFDEVLFKAGVQLQTAVYLSEAIRQFKEKNKDKEFKPGAMFYYHMYDPILATSEEDDEAVERLRGENLRPQGIFVDDGVNPELLESTESRPGGMKSRKLPVSYNSDRTISGKTKKSVKTAEEMEQILTGADDKVKELVSGVLDGRIAVSPLYISGRFDACEYCAYKSACGFDARSYGYKKRGADGSEVDGDENDGTDDGSGEDE